MYIDYHFLVTNVKRYVGDSKRVIGRPALSPTPGYVSQTAFSPFLDPGPSLVLAHGSNEGVS